VHADAQQRGAAAAHVRRRAAADEGDLQPRDARLDAADLVAAQELRRAGEERRAVVDEQALAPRGAARGHDPVLAEVQRIVVEPVEVLEQGVPAKAAIADDVVEALHQRRLVEHRQLAEPDRTVR
jgi:hypothetical protein